MLTTLVAVCVALVPGAVLGFALPPGRYRWAAWAAAPALTLGLTSLAMAWLPLVGLPDSALAVLVAELATAGVIVLLSRVVGRGLHSPTTTGELSTQSDEAPTRSDQPATQPAVARHGRVIWWTRLRMAPVRPRRADVLGVAVPSVISIGLGWLLLGRTGAVPGWDAMNHGILTQNILFAGTSKIASVCTTGTIEGAQACSFYPLAGNVIWAQTLQLAGGFFSTVLLAWAIIISPLAMVAGVYACVRALGGQPLVASSAALAPAFIGPMYLIVNSGRIPEQAAPCMAGAVALLIGLAIRGVHPVRLGVLAGLGSAGIVMLHTYDALFIGVLAVGIAVVARAAWNGRRVALGIAVAGAAALIPLVPYLPVLLGAGGERTSLPPAMRGRYGQALRFWVLGPERYAPLGYPPPGVHTALHILSVQVALVITIACGVASLACLFLTQLRWARPWFAAGVVFTLIGIWTTASGSAPAKALAGLWYGDRERLRSMIEPVYGVLVIAGAVAIGLGVRWLIPRLRRHARVMTAGATAGVAAGLVMASLVALTAVPSTWQPLRTLILGSEPVGSFYPAAFEWLTAHTQPGRVVAMDRNREMLTWVYADYKVPVLIGLPINPPLDRTNFSQRWAAWNWLVNNPGAGPAGCLVRRFGVQYVVTSERKAANTISHHYEDKWLQASDRLMHVQQFGPIDIYEVTDVGLACASSAAGVK